MRIEHLKYLVCPACKSDLVLTEKELASNDRVGKGILECSSCSEKYPIIRDIPRFVPLVNYASGFGFEWNKHARTQYDSYSGANVSETRFFKETKWSRQLQGEIILEVGSGSGRFTEQAASTGAMVFSLDYSDAVEANFASNGDKENVLIVQGDLYRMPFKTNFFDKVLCIGVLQHTPDVEKSFMALPTYLKPGGNLVIDVYRKPNIVKRLFFTKYWLRPITKRFPPEKLYNWCKKYVEFMWPVSVPVSNIPHIGRYLNGILLIPNYKRVYDLSDPILKECAALDLFDEMSPTYDSPQSIPVVRSWFETAELVEVEVCRGYNGMEGRGTKRRPIA